MDKFNYKILMNNPSIVINETVINRYKKLTSMANLRLLSKDVQTNNYDYIYKTIKEEILKCDFSEQDVVDMLIKQYFFIQHSTKKKVFWECFGDVVFKNLKTNLKNFEACSNCGKRFYKKSNNHILCPTCSENKEYYTPIEIKKIVCVDCGETVEIGSKNNKTNRCIKCQKIINKEKAKERVQKFRSKNATLSAT